MQSQQDLRTGTGGRPRIPTASKAGLGVIGIGVLADLIAHLDPGLASTTGALTGAQLSAHLVTFLGMVLVLGGVVLDAIRSNRYVRVRAAQGRHLDAGR